MCDVAIYLFRACVVLCGHPFVHWGCEPERLRTTRLHKTPNTPSTLLQQAKTRTDLCTHADINISPLLGRGNQNGGQGSLLNVVISHYVIINPVTNHHIYLFDPTHDNKTKTSLFERSSFCTIYLIFCTCGFSPSLRTSLVPFIPSTHFPK